MNISICYRTCSEALGPTDIVTSHIKPLVVSAIKVLNIRQVCTVFHSAYIVCCNARFEKKKTTFTLDSIFTFFSHFTLIGNLYLAQRVTGRFFNSNSSRLVKN